MNTSLLVAADGYRRSGQLVLDEVQHDLSDVLTLALCAVIGGADSWRDVELYGDAKYPWLRSFLGLPNGVPNQLIMERLFDRIDPVACDALITPWVQSNVRKALHGDVARHQSSPRMSLLSAIDMVSVWVSAERLTFGQFTAAGMSNEECAIPALLTLLNLDDAVVAVDLGHGQTGTAKAVHRLGEHYVVALPKGAVRAQAAVNGFLAAAAEDNWTGIAHQYLAAVESRDGRTAKVHYWISSDPELLATIDPHSTSYPGLASVCIVDDEGGSPGGSHRRTVFVSNLDGDTAGLIQSVRSIRAVPDSLHWVVDIADRFDGLGESERFAGENLAVLRRAAAQVLRHDAPNHLETRARRLRAGWDNDHLLNLLASGGNLTAGGDLPLPLDDPAASLLIASF